MRRLAEHPRTAFIGGGNVASHLIPWFQQHGFEVNALIHPSEERLMELATRFDLPVAATTPDALPEDIHLLLLSVPDRVLAPLAKELADLERDWSSTLVVHFSGALPAAILAPLAARGALPLSMHPLQTLREGTPTTLRGLYAILEGPPEAVDMGRTLAHRLEWIPVEISETDKARYHLTASIASNFLVTLMALVEEVCPPALQEVAPEMLHPLLVQTLENVRATSPEEALTGPIVRGDLPTLEKHLNVMQRERPHLLPVYAALAMETVRLAIRSGRLEPKIGERLLDRLHRSLHETNGHTSP